MTGNTNGWMCVKNDGNKGLYQNELSDIEFSIVTNLKKCGETIKNPIAVKKGIKGKDCCFHSNVYCNLGKVSMRTIVVKNIVAKIACGKGFRVYANKLCKEVVKELKKQSGINANKYWPNKEWLYDMCWCKENENNAYFLEKLVLALECEWSGKRKYDSDKYGNMKYDFQKLLVVNADTHVMIFVEHLDEKVENISEYITKAIENCEHTRKGSRFLCIAYAKNFDSFKYRLFVKNNE